MPARTSVSRVVRVVVDDAVSRGDVVTHHRGELVGRVDSMRARAVDDYDLRGGHVAECGEQPRQQPIGRQRPRDVGDDDGDAVRRAHDLGQRTCLDRPRNRVEKCGVLVVQSSHEARLEDRHAARDVDVEPAVPVLQVHSHGAMIADYRLRTTPGLKPRPTAFRAESRARLEPRQRCSVRGARLQSCRIYQSGESRRYRWRMSRASPGNTPARRAASAASVMRRSNPRAVFARSA